MRLLFFFSLLCLSGVAEVATQARIAIAQGRYDRAQELLLSSSDLTPELRVMLLEAAVMGDAEDQKVEKIAAAINVEGDPALTTERDFWLAAHDLRSGEYGKALSSFNALYRIPESAYRNITRRNIVKIHLGLGDLETAQQLILEGDITESKPDRMLYAEVLIAKGDFPAAENVLKTGIFEELESIDKSFALARIYYSQGKMEEAEQVMASVDYSPLSEQGRRLMSFHAFLKSERNQPGGYGLILSVLEKSTPNDPYVSYLDQLLLSAQVEKVDNGQTRAELIELQETWSVELQPNLLFTLAQLQDELLPKIELLTRISLQHPESSMAPRATLLAGQLSMQIDDEEVKKRELNKVIASASSDVVKAKIYTWMAEVSEGAVKTSYYQKALDVANEAQKPVISLNYNLSQLYLPSESQKILPLPESQFSSFLYEQAIQLSRAKPEESLRLLHRFLEISSMKDPRQGTAHLMLAESKLEQNDPQLGNEIKAHLESFRSRFIDLLPEKRERFEIAQLRLSALTNNETRTRDFIERHSNNKANLVKSGKILYDLGKYQLSRLQFQKLEGLELTPSEQEIVSFYTSLCYIKLGVTEYEQQGLAQLEALQANKGRLARQAQLTLAQYYLDQGDATNSLKYVAGLPSNYHTNFIRARAHSLLNTPENRKQARLFYDKLYRDSSIPITNRYLVAQQYSKFLESSELFSEEVELYYQLVNFEVIPEPDSKLGWSVFKALSLRAIDLMESLGQWRNAYNFAKSVTLTNLPDAEVFSKRAEEISLKHILWED